MLKPFITATAVSIFLASVASIYPAQLSAQEKSAFSEADDKRIEQVIERYLDENPEIVVRAFRKFQRQQEEKQQAQQEQNLTQLRAQLEKSPSSPVRGNPEGDVTLVEFFDYRCGYCKRVHGAVTDTVEADGNVRLVYKEFPILGPESVFASRASLGVYFAHPLKYPAFHNALMTTRGQLNSARVIEIAGELGLEPEDIKAAMKDPRVDQEIQNNMQLAQSLGINGTPGFVIGQEIVPGAVDEDALKQLIAKAREG